MDRDLELLFKTLLGRSLGLGMSLNNISILSYRIGDHRKKAITLNLLSRVYLEMKDLNKSRQCLKRAYNAIRETKEKEILQRIALSRAGLELASVKSGSAPLKASFYADQVLKLADELKSKSGRAEAPLLRARIDNAKGMGQRAQGGFHEAIRIFEELKQPFDAARAYFYRAQDLGSGKEGIKDLQKSKTVIHEARRQGMAGQNRVGIPK